MCSLHVLHFYLIYRIQFAARLPPPQPPKKDEMHYSDQVSSPNGYHKKGYNTRNTEECEMIPHSLYTDRPTTVSEEAVTSILRMKVFLPSDIAC